MTPDRYGQQEENKTKVSLNQLMQVQLRLQKIIYVPLENKLYNDISCSTGKDKRIDISYLMERGVVNRNHTDR